MATVTETFTHADQSGALTADLTWTLWQGSSWGILSNQAACSGIHDPEKARAEVDTSSADHAVQATLTAIQSNLTGYLNAGIYARKDSSSTDTCYIFSARFDTQGVYFLHKQVAGVFNQLGSTVFQVPVAGDVLKLDCTGTTISAYVNGVLKIQVPDSSITTGTRGGLYYGADRIGHSCVFDNWSITGGSAYSLAASVGAYSLTGSTTSLNLNNRSVMAGAGSFAVTGSAATVVTQRGIGAEPFDYVIGGSTVTLVKGTQSFSLTMSTGAYFITAGTPVAFRETYRVDATAGLYTIDQVPVTLLVTNMVTNYPMVAGPGAYLFEAELGTAILLLENGDAFLLEDSSGHLLLETSGSPVTLTVNHVLTNALIPDPASFLLTGLSAGLAYSRQGPVDSGSYAFTGQDVGLFYGLHTLSADAGDYTLTGTAVTLQHGSRTMTVESGSYSVSGVRSGARSDGAGGFTLSLVGGHAIEMMMMGVG